MNLFSSTLRGCSNREKKGRSVKTWNLSGIIDLDAVSSEWLEREAAVYCETFLLSTECYRVLRTEQSVTMVFPIIIIYNQKNTENIRC